MNPDQQIALASVIAGGAVGLAGLLVAVLGGWRDRESARAMAREERHQSRIADAYVALLEGAEKIGNWAALVRPVIDTNPPQAPPPLPDVDAQYRVEALVNAYGSGEVKAALEEWRESVRAIRRADRKISVSLYRAQDGSLTAPHVSYLDVWQELEDTLRPDEVAARKKLVEQVSSELRPPKR